MHNYIKSITAALMLLAMTACAPGGGSESGPEGVTIPDVPGAPAVTAGDGRLSLTWEAVEDATHYEAWYSETDDSLTAMQDGGDIAETGHVIAGLTNGVTYFVWLKAKNIAGTSGFGPAANGAPLETGDPFTVPNVPGAPVITPGYDYFTLSWDPVAGAEFYEVWYSETDNPLTAIQHGGDISDTFFPMLGLDMNTTYFIWIKAKNSAGTSGFSPSVNGILVSLPDAPGAATVATGDSILSLTCQEAEQARLLFQLQLPTTEEQRQLPKSRLIFWISLFSR